jgi:hypothetical protein
LVGLGVGVCDGVRDRELECERVNVAVGVWVRLEVWEVVEDCEAVRLDVNDRLGVMDLVAEVETLPDEL